MSRLEPLLICKEDFECVGQVAKHCNWEQLCIYIREQQNLSLLPKIGQCLFDKLLRLKQGWYIPGEECQEDERDILKHIFLGGRYKACDGSTKVHFGLKRVLVHWSYGAYMYRHGIVDTPFGAVQKVHQDSVPIEVKDLKNINIEHRNNAEYYWDLTKDYICSVKDCEVLEDCTFCSCISSCRCGYCTDGKTKQRRGTTFSNVSKF